MTNIAKADMLEKWFQTDSHNDGSVFSPRFISMHPGGGRSVLNGQTEEWIHNKHMWAPPEGTLPLGNDVLRKADCNN